MTKQLILVFACAVGLSVPTTRADERKISPVREAAIKRMQAKLGAIRGTISPEDVNVVLTDRMIEMLRPIAPREARTDQKIAIKVETLTES